MALKKNPRFDLKLHYRRTLEIGMVCSICLLLAAFKYFPDHEVEKVKKKYWEPDVTVEDVENTIQDEIKLPPPPKPQPEILIETIDDEILDDIEFEDNSIDKNADLSLPPKIQKDKNIVEPEPFFKAVEEMPTIIGGLESLYEKIYYPEMAVKVGISGRVYIQAFVDKTGNVVDVKLVKGIGGGCDEVALNAVQAIRFNPGKQRGKAVKVQVMVPIEFKLEN